MLLPYISMGVIPKMKQERWRVPTVVETELLLWEGEFVIFMSFLDRGVGVPTSAFLRRLLAFYNIKISDLAPHSIQQISLFIALCEYYLCCPPYFPLWLSYFHGRATRQSKDDPTLVPVGAITFQVKPDEVFIDMALPKKAQSQWRKYWFYVKETTPKGEVAITQYTPEPSKPRRLNVRSLPREQERVVKKMNARIEVLKITGLSAVNLYNYWLTRRLVPLRCRGHYMWEYTGQNDCTRVFATEWAEAEYKRLLAKITTAPFTSFNAELQPHTSDNPGPTVRPLIFSCIVEDASYFA
jgi:hypothetical protein